MRESSDLLGNPAELRARMDKEGYLFFRGVLDTAALHEVRREMTEVLVGTGVMVPGRNQPTWTGRVTKGVGAEGKNEDLQASYAERRIWERLVEQPSVRGFIESVMGEPVTFLPIAEYRSTAPGDATIVHQDGLYNDGFDMHTAWMPLIRVDEMLGGLAIAAGTNGRGYFPTVGSPPIISPGAVAPELWHRADYEPGDVVIFPDTTVHCGLVNRSAGLLRLSLEVRFQGASAPPAVLGRIAEVTKDSITVNGDKGVPVTLAVTEDTFLRSLGGYRIPKAELLSSELRGGVHVLAAQREGVAVSVRPTRENV
jgi:hypothetical protein